MRIITWNCCGGFKFKAAALLRLNPDVAIVPESCESPHLQEHTAKGMEIRYQWIPSYAKDRGLGILSARAKRLELIEAKEPPTGSTRGKYATACHIDLGKSRHTFVGVWTVRTPESKNYLADSAAIAEQFAPVLETGSAVLAGDFNIPNRTNLKETAELIRSWEQRFQLVSAYHSFHGVALGEESHSTHWHHYVEGSAFHCDFVFVPKNWKIANVEVGTYAEWGSAQATARSDHAPVIVDVEPC